MGAQMISRYRVVRRLGSGGMGEVLLAEDTQLERFVAIKLMSAELARDPNQRQRFRTEAKAASGLSHPNICVIHEVSETEDGRPFLAMEFVEGQTLDVVLQQRRLAMREILAVGIQIAEALDAAHGRRIVHRDIKPTNIMLNGRGQAKVLDFGLAKRFAQDGLSDSTGLASAQTQTGILIGTPHYMSPEQALGRELDHRTDIFSLGAVLYELITGRRPFLGKTVGETINTVVNQPPAPLGLENPRFTPALDKIIFKCLEKDPLNRYAAAKELAADLTRLKDESDRASAANMRPGKALAAAAPSVDPRAEPTKRWPRGDKSERPGKRPTVFVAGLTILLAGAAIGFYLVDNPGAWLRPRIGTGPRAGSNQSTATVAPAAPKSVAVLPFDNFSAEKDTDYLSDGLSDEITTALSRLPGLKVAARNSAFTFKGHKEDLRKVGAALGVATLLEGSMRKAGRQVRVTAQLINVADGFHLWSETYESSMEDIIAVQQEIARQIAERFELKTSAGSASSAASRPAPKPEVYALYLQGLHFWNKRTKGDLETAAQLFRQAIDRDATYAGAHAGLAACYALMPDYSLRPSSEYFPLARAAAGKALALDPSSADAHAVLGLVKCFNYDFPGAEEEYRRALELNPNHASARHWYGVQLREVGRMDDAWRELRRAEELDPLSPIIKFNLLTMFVYTRQYDQGMEECRKYQQAFPDFALYHDAMAWFYCVKGRHQEAIDELLQLRSTIPDGPASLDHLGYNYARNGDEARARQVLAELEEWKKKGYAVRAMMGFVFLGLREYDKAFDACNEAVEAHETLLGLQHEPTFDEVRTMPRFQALLKKIGQAN